MLCWLIKLSHLIFLQLILHALDPFTVVIEVEATSEHPPEVNEYRRQGDRHPGEGEPGVGGNTRGDPDFDPNKKGPALNQAQRFTTKIYVTKRLDRTPPYRSTYEEECDLIANYCLKGYNTGRLCGKTIYNKYITFKNYCMLDYVNCMQRYEMWQLVHMGHCYEAKLVTEYIHFPMEDDFFLDADYVVDDQNNM